MLNIISFNIKDPNNIPSSRIKFPTEEDIDLMKAKISLYDHDEMVLVEDWDGYCWKTFFEVIVTQYALEHGLDPWDCFAYLVGKMFG